MNKTVLVLGTVVVVVAAFVGGAVLFKGRSTPAVTQVAPSNTETLVRPHAPVFGNPAAKVTIVEFFDLSCEACRAFYPAVKRIVNASFGEVRLLLRYAPLHQGSVVAVQILEATRLQGQYWPALERALADQPLWGAHGSPQPELIWTLIGGLGLDMARAKSDAGKPEIAANLRQDIADMQALQVRQTPSFFVNGTPLREFGEAPLKALVDQARQKLKATP